MSKIYATIGASGSGKSTWINRYAKVWGLKVVCPDTIRGELSGGNEGDQSKNAEVFRLVAKRLLDILEGGESVCYDATNYNNKNREIVEFVAKKTDSMIEWHVFEVPFETLVKRQDLRDRKVPVDVIKRQFDNMTIPNPNANVKIVRH